MVLAKVNYQTFREPLAYITFGLIALALPSSFIYEKASRVLFYWSAYFSVAGLLMEWLSGKKVLFNDKKAVSFLLLGALYYSWSLYADYASPSADELFFTAGKRCLLVFIIISSCTHLVRSGYISEIAVKRLSYASLGSAFIVASGFALFQSFISDDRVVMGINRATMSAYTYSMLSLTLLALLSKRKMTRPAALCFLTIGILSLYVITLTQTRSAMVIHFCFILFFFLSLFKALKSKNIILFFLASLCVPVALSHQVIQNRIDTTFEEYVNYTKGNDQTSLGSRFTLWKMGVMAFEHAPLGETQYERNNFIDAYLKQHGNSESWAKIYIKVHLHNEFIQFASLFGIVGLGVLAAFFWVFILSEIKIYRQITPIAVMGFTTLLYGMTDVLMTSLEYILIFSVLTVLVSTQVKQGEN